MDKDAARKLTGAQLVADYQATMVNLAGAEVSAIEARESEDRAVQELQYFSQGTILNPSYIPHDSGATIARASMDAHIKKVQAEQIERMSKSQLAAMTHEAQEKYTGKPVTIRVLDIDDTPIESVWFDNRRGYYKGTVRTKQLKGSVREVWLDRNVLLINPTLSSRIFNPGRKFFFVYVINPETLQPMVELELG